MQQKAEWLLIEIYSKLKLMFGLYTQRHQDFIDMTAGSPYDGKICKAINHTLLLFNHSVAIVFPQHLRLIKVYKH